MINIIKPRVGGLFQTIQWLVLSTNNTIIFHKTRRFVHLYFFSKVSIKEGTFSSKSRMKGEDCMNWVHFCNKGKGFSVVNALLLRESLGYLSILMMFNNTFRGKLGLIDPSTLQNMLSLRLRNYQVWVFTKESILAEITLYHSRNTWGSI